MRARAPRFAGTAPEPREGLRGGHIPGSLNLPYDELADPKTRALLPAEEIRGASPRRGSSPASRW